VFIKGLFLNSRYLKYHINGLDIEVSEEEAKAQLIQAIEDFVKENITLAAKQIALTAIEKIRDEDVILTYGWYVT
jgi:translation initiation factor eIF-2B subunit delta